MKLEQQVCSLELAKKLKELGVKQDSIFRWRFTNDFSIRKGFEYLEEVEMKPVNLFNKQFGVYDYISAFTIAELGEILPKRLKHHWKVGSMYKFKKGTYVDLKISCNDRTGTWVVSYYGDTGFESDIKDIYFHGEMADTEADARAKMLIYLLENNLIK